MSEAPNLSEAETVVGKRLYKIAENLIYRAIQDPGFTGEHEVAPDIFDSTVILREYYNAEGTKQVAKKLGLSDTSSPITRRTKLSVWDGVRIGGGWDMKGSDTQVAKNTLGGISLWEDNYEPDAENQTTYVIISDKGKIEGKVIRNQKGASYEAMDTQAATQAAFRILSHVRSESSKQRKMNKSDPDQAA